MTYKIPLSVYIIWHPENKDGQKIADELYSLLCRNIDKPLIRTIGIPVYFRNMKPLKEIRFEESTHTAIIPLIDDLFVVDNDLSQFINSLYDEYIKGTNKIGIYPVALSKNAFKISAKLNKINYIKAEKSSVNNWEEVFHKMKRPVLHQLCRLLMDLHVNNKKPPVKLFISHSKHDDGLEYASKFKNFVNDETQLNTFFDVNDIPFGTLFSEEIRTGVKESALVVFQSDTYADREWCRIEVLEAKKQGCPITIVNAIKKGEQRTFPYLGNSPSIRYESQKDFSEIINLTLLQVLKNLYLAQLLDGLTDLYQIKTDNILTTSPELFHFIKLKQIHDKENRDFSLFIYPDPPLGSEELELLNQMDDRFSFITPLTLPSIAKQ